jgi:hypothetical protein
MEIDEWAACVYVGLNKRYRPTSMYSEANVWVIAANVSTGDEGEREGRMDREK